MEQLLGAGVLSAFGQVVVIDLVLAGDNAIVIGMAAAGLHAGQRSRAILLGIAAATVLRIAFASVTVQLLAIVGLLLAGGLLLLWVSWRLWRELRVPPLRVAQAEEALSGQDLDGNGSVAGRAPPKTLRQATVQIVVADISMSLDNVLGVAGAAREHPFVLVFGLALSIALMAVAASYLARALDRHRWIAFLGLAVILYVALSMIVDGAREVLPVLAARV